MFRTDTGPAPEATRPSLEPALRGTSNFRAGFKSRVNPTQPRARPPGPSNFRARQPSARVNWCALRADSMFLVQRAANACAHKGIDKIRGGGNGTAVSIAVCAIGVVGLVKVQL